MEIAKRNTHAGYTGGHEREGDFLCQTPIKKETGTGMAEGIYCANYMHPAGDYVRACIIAVTPTSPIPSPTLSIKGIHSTPAAGHHSTPAIVHHLTPSSLPLTAAPCSPQYLTTPIPQSLPYPLPSPLPLYALLFPIYTAHTYPRAGHLDPVKPSRVAYMNSVPPIPRDIRAIKALTHKLTAS